MFSEVSNKNVSHSPMNGNTHPLIENSPPRQFVLNNQGERRCIFKASGGEEVSIVIHPESSKLHVFVRDEHDWKPIDPLNLPKELQEGFSTALERLVKVAVFTVSNLSSGSCRLELEGEDEQRGRMAQIAERRLLEQQFLLKLLPNIDGELSVSMDHFALTPVGDFLKDVLPMGSIVTASLIASGSGFAMVALSGGIMLIPLLCISAALTAGIVISTGISVHLEEKQKLAKGIIRLIKDAEECFQQTYTAYLTQDEGKIIDTVNKFMSKLIEHKFVKEYSSRLFEFNETGFENMTTLYSKKDEESVSAMMKLLILFSAELLPLKFCPSAAILECLEKVKVDSVPDNIGNYIFIAMGRLNINRGDKDSARANFKRVSKDSDLYRFAEEYLGVLDAVEQQFSLF